MNGQFPFMSVSVQNQTDSCTSPLPGLESWAGQVRKLPVTWGQAVVFAGYSDFLHHL